MTTQSEQLEQMDYFEEDFIEEVDDVFFTTIGRFLVEFSGLESTLNIAIADLLHDDYHGIGYTVIENLNLLSKIQLYDKLCRQRISYARNRNRLKERLKKIILYFDDVRVFRNKIAHANWRTLSKDYNVRTKISTNKDSGDVEFKNERMTITDIDQNIDKANWVEEKIYALIESINNSL